MPGVGEAAAEVLENTAGAAKEEREEQARLKEVWGPTEEKAQEIKAREVAEKKAKDKREEELVDSGSLGRPRIGRKRRR